MIFSVGSFESDTIMETRSALDSTGADIHLFTMPSPYSKRKVKGGDTSTPSGVPGVIHSPVTVVTSPKFTITHKYNLASVFDILANAGLERPISLGLPLDDASRISARIMTEMPMSELWVSLKPVMLVDAGICSAIQSALVLSVMCKGLESLSLMTSEDRFATVGGPPVLLKAIPDDADKMRERSQKRLTDFSRAVSCPGIISGSKEMKYVPSREHLLNFLRELCSWISLIDKTMAKIVREVAETHGPDETLINGWNTQLGEDGKGLLYTILVTKSLYV